MVPNRTEQYKGYEIRIYITPRLSPEPSFRARYEVQLDQSETSTVSTVTIVFSTMRDAERVALSIAKSVVDQNLSSG